MNFVPCLTWVSKGIAKSVPDKVQLSAEELKLLIQETKEDIRNQADSDDEPTADTSDNENEVDTKVKNDADGSDEDFDAKYDLDGYDDSDDERPFMNLGDVTMYVDNKEDEYITGLDAVSEDEKEEEEDFRIKENDNLLIVGHVESESSVLEIHVYNKDEDTFYVHHDIVLPAYPLALEWLNYHPSDETKGNYVAVGDMSPVIKVWDLDVADILEPDYCLGQKKKKKKAEEKTKLKCHTDSVLSLSWNKHLENVLASGSADSSIILWDLEVGKGIKRLRYHPNKVQALQWNPFENSYLLSGCTDGVIKLYDSRSNNEYKSWNVDGEVEKVCWNLSDSSRFLCSTDKGFVFSFDLRNDEIEHSMQVHSEAVTGLDICPQRPNILMTSSMDKMVKLWDMDQGKLLSSQKLKVGSIYTAKFAPDSELVLAVGGNCASNSLKIIDLVHKLDGTVKVENVSSDELESLTNAAIQPKEEITSPPPKKKAKKPKKVKFESGQPSWNMNSEPSTSTNTYFPKKKKNKQLGPKR